MIDTFLTNFKFIIGFIVLVFLVQLFMGDSASEGFALMVLFTMIILNADEFVTFTKTYF